MNTFLSLSTPAPDIALPDDACLRPLPRPAKPLPFLDACEFARHHDLLIMNLREDLTDDRAIQRYAPIFNIDLP